ncbi:hypothetical protein [Streptomyces sp. YIM 98790]|uniref:hypothetical protein n=1 Tax=Streptomyces sp. YIM 98790 TaxID=2689077 RepID=UPI00140D10CC|nr:hypothetical protein [Streptomyces sp. YIM 98790]
MRRRQRARLTRLTTALAAVTVLTLGLLAPGTATAHGRPQDAPRPPAAPGCDPIDPAACLLPFPSDWYTVPDRTTDTGRRVRFDPDAMPVNAHGTGIDPAEWNRNDGFSPGSMVLARVPGIDLARTGAAPLTDIGASLAPDAPIVLLDTVTGERWPYWAELDAQAGDPARQALIIRPARNLTEGHRYAVVLRDLKDADGRTLRPTDAYRTILGPKLKRSHPLAARQKQQRHGVLKDLRRHRVSTANLYLAWDFTVAGERGLSERMLHIRDDAFAALGDRAPGFRVTEVTENPPEDPIARRVRGLLTVPSYLDRPGGPPGSAFHYDDGRARGRGTGDGLPDRADGNTQTTPFQCEIPRSALGTPALPSLYGHGLLGRETEVGAANVRAMAAEHNVVLCATRWSGMAQDDIPNVLSALGDLSRFHTIADRSQQGMLNALWLGRAMIHPDGLPADPAFASDSGASVIDPDAALGYIGNSQGGIIGGALMAVATDIPRGVLGVPGMNYSTLLDRSSAFLQFAPAYRAAYPDPLDRQLGYALMQMLWDRGEAAGYAHHMTDDPLPGTPAHQVLMHVAFGDHQVSPTAAEVQARTIGARLHTPAAAEGRNPDTEPYWGIPAIDYPYTGSAMVVWDSGSPYQPLTNTPPTTGRDPHSDPRNSPEARLQQYVFLSTGEVIDVCGGRPCTAAPAG